MKQHETQSTTDEDIFRRQCTALAIQKTVSKQLSWLHLQQHEKLESEGPAVRVDVSKIKESCYIKMGQLRSSVKGEAKRTNDKHNQYACVLLTEKSPRMLLHFRVNDSAEINTLKYQSKV